ncbi:MAG: VCBS repeat-containing protein [Cyclobacteriaceae bacterium]
MRNILIILFVLGIFSAFAQQRPFVNSIDKLSTTVGETIAISGSGFSPGNMKVYIGKGEATITSESASLIEVTIPASASYGPITVLNTSTRLSGVSRQYFNPAFSGGVFDAGDVGVGELFETNQQYGYDLCGCDFDGDYKIDIAIANNNSDFVSIFLNTSTLSTSNFNKSDFNIGAKTIATECGDLNGDGLADLIFTTSDGLAVTNVHVYQNTSSIGNISFAPNSFQIPNQSADVKRNARKLKLGDLDGDGKNDLVVGSEIDNSLFVYRNSSTGASITFDTPIELISTGAINAGVIELADFNNNGQLDIVSFSYSESDQIHLFKNESSSGNISFASSVGFGSNSIRLNTASADLNSDGKLEIITTSAVSDEVNIFTNNSTSNTISFESSATTISNINNGWGLSVGDVNGDGKPDINLASTANGVYVLENTSTDSNISFTSKTISTSGNRNIAVLDLNGDSKLDFALVNNSSETAFGNLLVITNRNCIEPSIGPSDLTFCLGNAFTLSATKSAETTYNWSVTAGDATINSNGSSDASITVNSETSANIRVTITSNDGLCTSEKTETFTLTGGSPPSAPAMVPSKTGTICAGESFTITATAGRDSYLWTLPNGEEITQTSNELNVENATSADAGEYKLRVLQTGSCVSNEATLSISIDEPPVVSIFNNGEDNFCANSTVVLEVPNYEGFTYQWKNGTTDIDGQITNTYTANTSGDYSVAIVSNTSGCSNTSPTYSLNAVALPNSRFVADEEICVDVETGFTSTSTGSSGFSLIYAWDFKDGNTAIGRDTFNTFATANTYSVSLLTSYSEIASCSTSVSQDIVVSEPQAVDISLPEGSEKCPADSLRLELPEGFQRFAWSLENSDDTISTLYFVYAKTLPEEENVTIEASMITDIGCAVNSSITVGNYMNSRVIISSSEATITNDTITLENGVSTVLLTGENASSYSWEPTDILKFLNTDSSNVEAFPKDEFTTVSLTGPDLTNGCTTTEKLVIQTPGVVPRKSFSPNADGLGFDCWEILNTDQLDGCTVYIFDQRGATLFKGDSPFTDNCVWNGNIDNGSSQAPEGIYYFVMKCENSRFEKSGAILLAR